MRTLDYAGVCIQARAVGGDYYDFLDLARNRVALVIGDIAGKGIAAALLMANLQANLRSQCVIASEQPQHVLDSVNRVLFENTDAAAYATLFFAEYDDESLRLRYANCGHLPALVLREDGTLESLHATSPVLGLFADWQCSMSECRLHAGDMFVLYTDGITDSFNEAGEEFGDERLIAWLRRYHDRSSAEIVKAVVDDVEQFSFKEQFDDITVVVAKCGHAS